MSLTSFLPDEVPLRDLPAYFAPWTRLVAQLPQLNENKTTRKEVSALPLLDATELKTVEEIRLAYSILSMIAHSYVWCEGLENGIPVLPRNVAMPFNYVSKKLGLPQVLTHAAVDLWNYYLKDPRGPHIVENMELINSMTGTESEKTFYLVMTEIEAHGRDIVPFISTIPDLITKNETGKICEILKQFNNKMNDIIIALSKMYKGCKPDVFYNNLRKFLNGWEKLKDGIIFEGVSDDQLKFAGGSAAQSSLIALFDIVFGVKHTSGNSCVYLNKMRNYMPGEHREFLEQVQKSVDKNPLDKYVMTTDNKDLTDLYNKSIELILLFRQRHMGLVHSYILQMMPKTEGSAVGTGGTELRTFLKECQTDTSDKFVKKAEGL